MIAAYAALAVVIFVLGYALGRKHMADFTRVNDSLNRLDSAVTDAVAALTSPDADQPQIDAVANRIDDAIARLESALPATPPAEPPV